MAPRGRTIAAVLAIAVAAVAALLLFVRKPASSRRAGGRARPPVAAPRADTPRVRAGNGEPPLRSDDSSPRDPAPSRGDAERALDLLDAEQFDEARALAKTCLAADPQNRSCWQTLLWSYTRTGAFDEARPMLEDCLAQDPDDVGCLGGMTTQLVRDGDLEGADELASRIWALMPESMQAYLADGQIADMGGDDEAAIDAYEHACSFGQPFACRRAEELASR